MQHAPYHHTTSLGQTSSIHIHSDTNTPIYLNPGVTNNVMTDRQDHDRFHPDFPHGPSQTWTFPPYAPRVGEFIVIPTPPQSVQSFIPDSPWNLSPRLPQPSEIYNSQVSSLITRCTRADGSDSKATTFGMRPYHPTSNPISTEQS